jgi:uncharacterized YccA/Bax inhibitor family protein
MVQIATYFKRFRHYFSMAMRSNNPLFKEEYFRGQGTGAAGTECMTIEGTVQKILFLFTVLAAVFAYSFFVISPNLIGISAAGLGMLLLAIFGALIGFAVVFRKEWAFFLAPIYTVIQGILLGFISLLYETAFSGIVLQAIVLTLADFAIIFAAYHFRVIRVTDDLKMGILASTGAIATIYLVSIVSNFAGHPIPYIHDAGPVGIIFSIVVVVIASLNFLLDFNFIEEGAKNKVPKCMEWYGAFGLMVTFVWVYLEILKLLGKLRKRR